MFMHLSIENLMAQKYTDCLYVAIQRSNSPWPFTRIISVKCSLKPAFPLGVTISISSFVTEISF